MFPNDVSQAVPSECAVDRTLGERLRRHSMLWDCSALVVTLRCPGPVVPIQVCRLST